MRLDKQKITGVMSERGIGTFAELADMIGVHPVTLSNWLTGKFDPEFRNLEKLCEVLNCRADDIIAYDRPKAMALAAM